MLDNEKLFLSEKSGKLTFKIEESIKSIILLLFKKYTKKKIKSGFYL